VEHQKLKSYHFAAENFKDRTEWVDMLTQAATLRSDENARFVLLMLSIINYSVGLALFTESAAFVVDDIDMIQ